MSIPKLKQKFKITYNYFRDDKVIVCHVSPKQLPFDLHTFYNGPFKGVAIFKDGDTFNKRMGEEIARKKAIRAYFKWFKRTYFDYWNSIKTEAEMCLKIIEHADEKINVLTNEIIEMTKED